ncbi:YktB family protein [Aquibacillus sediminis]|uniref:YktB family protein n=1 Tax=Aquibacillus sediminis TaxID=2574734 RepID=UPI00110968E7|nr:DUF1054 domain-containing protein [Aquibacillus sediminis]
MTFEGFVKQDFETFYIDGLEERMEAIQTRIQPKFKEISEAIIDHLSDITNYDMHLHIAKHARRTVNPPQDTWSAYCHNKRGYKKHPHFQIGLFDDHLFIWLAYIYELPNKQAIAKTFLDNIDDIERNIPNDFVVSLDHTKKDAAPIAEVDLTKALERLENVKKAEFLIGRHIKVDDPILTDGDALISKIKETFETLTPLYKLSMND